MTADKKGPKILARSFFTQLRTGGYTQNQIIDIATELLDLVTSDIRDGDKEKLSDDLGELRQTG